ncbi:TonB-dependent receptor plug domain-containing protein [Massilia cavernae]|uniref:TonB-dependent receptor n=1 Tax=Massilia cavernae TaxID=2320864 RepID=A0A418XQH8_9BURK|nr:TonB-dependent receptor [Massilia cavernae]RJG14769.1 TonB-dependent receptor [Massilia cavernae]
MTFPVSRRAALSSLALAITSTFAQAENTSQAAVTAVLVTATRAPQAAVDVLSDHIVLSSEDILRSGAGNVVDLLQKQRGIEVTRNGGPGTTASVFMRGGDSKQTVVLVDGVRIGSSTTGVANWAALPLANIDRIEIIYGPLATMYGADAIGGVVQLFTKRGAGAPAMKAAIGAGSEKARRAEAAVAGSTGGVSYAFAAAREQDDGFSSTLPASSSFNADKDGYRKESASSQLAVSLASGHEAGLLFLHSRLNAQYDAGRASYDVRTVQSLDNIALYSKHQLTPGWQLKLQASQADDKSANFSNATATGTSSIDTRQTAFSAQSDVALGAGLLQMLLERREEEVVSSSTAALTTGRTTNSAALAYSLKRDAHLATASTRIDDSSQYGSKVTGGIGYGYRITRTLRANASAGTSFRAPTFNELYFPGFGVAGNQPEHGKNVEAGLAFNDGATEATAVYYRNRITDLLVNTTPCPVEVATHPFGCAYNVNRAMLTGLSVGARTRLGDFDLRGAFDLQDPRDDTTGKQLVRRSRRHANFSVEYRTGPLVAGAGVHLSGKRFDDTANRNVLGGYGLLNLFASYRFAPDWSAIVRWNNATDKRYQLARNYATAGSQVFAGVRYGMN